MDRHLRAYAKGQLPKPDAAGDALLLPRAAIESVQKALAEAQAAEQQAESLKKDAEARRRGPIGWPWNSPAREGRVEQARQTIAKSPQGDDQPAGAVSRLRVLPPQRRSGGR